MMSWSQEQVLILIDEYRKHSCLYRVKNKNYRNKHARMEALNKILQQLLPYRRGITINDIKSKWNGVKTNFMCEHKKVLNSQKSGAGVDELYTPTIWYYSKLQFILEGNDVRPSNDSININIEFDDAEDGVNLADDELTETIYIEQLDEEDGYIMESSENEQSQSSSVECGPVVSVPKPPSKKSKRVMAHDKEDILLQNATAAVDNISSLLVQKQLLQEPVFGDFINLKLKQISKKHLRDEAEFEITKLVYEYLKKDNEEVL